MAQTLNLTAEWGKTFPKSDKVNHSKIIFTNRYGITLASDMYAPEGKLPVHTVLYDNLDEIPFDKIEKLFIRI